jgi:hypothetical protein
MIITRTSLSVMFAALTDCVSNKINGEWNPILSLVAIVNQRNFGHGKKTKASSSPSSFLLSYMDVKFGAVASLETHG